VFTGCSRLLHGFLHLWRTCVSRLSSSRPPSMAMLLSRLRHILDGNRCSNRRDSFHYLIRQSHLRLLVYHPSRVKHMKSCKTLYLRSMINSKWFGSGGCWKSFLCVPSSSVRFTTQQKVRRTSFGCGLFFHVNENKVADSLFYSVNKGRGRKIFKHVVRRGIK
jgi:hypothetical protein